MKELIDELLKHPTNKNINFIEELYDYISENKISNINQLKDNTDIDMVYNRIQTTFCAWDNLSTEETREMYQLQYDFEKQEELEKIKRLIRMHSIFKFELIFKYETYCMIINDEI